MATTHAPRKIVAKYRSLCKGCNESIQPGDDVYWVKLEGTYCGACGEPMMEAVANQPQTTRSLSDDLKTLRNDDISAIKEVFVSEMPTTKKEGEIVTRMASPLTLSECYCNLMGGRKCGSCVARGLE